MPKDTIKTEVELSVEEIKMDGQRDTDSVYFSAKLYLKNLNSIVDSDPTYIGKVKGHLNVNRNICHLDEKTNMSALRVIEEIGWDLGKIEQMIEER